MTEPVTDIDVAEITKIADQLARRERFLLEQQQWRSNDDRLRGYKEVQEARDKWIESATKTKEAVEEAKKDAEHGKAKLSVLESKVRALQPDIIKSFNAAKLRFEYIGEISDSTQALFDMVLTGVNEKIKEAVSRAQAATEFLAEVARARLSNSISLWVQTVNKGQGANMAFKNVTHAVIEQLYPNKIGYKLSVSESAIVQAKAVEMAGRSTKLSSLVGKLADNATLRAALIACAILLVDVINAAFDGGAVSAITTGIKGVVGIAAGTAAGIYAEAFISSATLFSAGAATMGVLGVAAGAIAGFVVGLVVGIVLDVLVDLICGLFETSQRKYWDEYMNTPIVYRIDVAP